MHMVCVYCCRTQACRLLLPDRKVLNSRATITSAHPGTSHFDARRFVRDMVDRNMLFTMSLVRLKLLLRSSVWLLVVLMMLLLRAYTDNKA
jgi:hypothetical protein